MYRLTLVISLACTTFSFIVHPPMGTYGVISRTMELTDDSRKDPFADSVGSNTYRRLMLSAFAPIGALNSCIPYTEQYMPSATAAIYDYMYDSLGLPSGIFGSLELAFCQNRRRHGRTAGDAKFPVVLFSPGLGNSRLIYSAMAQSLASQGNVVITVDHPHDASIVEYPDGTYVLAANITTPDQITFDLGIRVQDMSFILDQICSHSLIDTLFGAAAARVDINRFLMYGHSLGGATAVSTMFSDQRVIGAVNLDGSLWGQVVSHGVRCPMLLFAHQGKNLTTDPSWQQAWQQTKDTTKIELELHHSTEGSFTDFPLLAEMLGGGKIPAALTGLIGDLPGSRVDEVLNEYMGRFFDFALDRAEIPLPKNGSQKSFEVAVLEEVVNGNCNATPVGDL